MQELEQYLCQWKRAYKAQSAVYACYLMRTLAVSRWQDLTITSCGYSTRLCHTAFAGREGFLVTLIKAIILHTKQLNTPPYAAAWIFSWNQ